MNMKVIFVQYLIDNSDKMSVAIFTKILSDLNVDTIKNLEFR